MPTDGAKNCFWSIECCSYLAPEAFKASAFSWAPLVTASCASLREAISLLNSGDFGDLICNAKFCVVHLEQLNSYTLLYQPGLAHEVFVHMCEEFAAASVPSEGQLTGEIDVAELLGQLESQCCASEQEQQRLVEELNQAKGLIEQKTRTIELLNRKLKELHDEKGNAVRYEFLRPVEEPPDWAIEQTFALGSSLVDDMLWAPLIPQSQAESTRVLVDLLNSKRLQYPGNPNFFTVYSASGQGYYLLYKHGFKEVALTTLVKIIPTLADSRAGLRYLSNNLQETLSSLRAAISQRNAPGLGRAGRMVTTG